MNKIFTIKNSKGLHARAAAKFVETIEDFSDEDVIVSKGDLSVSGHSIMGLMMLGAPCNSKIKVECISPNANKILSLLEELIDAKFYED
ncbi:MAG: HPr family phosphocarrier protein [Alphaproteobacteria bacterium]|nr:HPr family phosphocarrier protein [Alphaproteobacteria bacterium]